MQNDDGYEDYCALFAYTFELKKQCAALMQERDIALSALDAVMELHRDIGTVRAHTIFATVDIAQNEHTCVRIWYKSGPVYNDFKAALYTEAIHAAAEWVRSTQEGHAS